MFLELAGIPQDVLLDALRVLEKAMKAVLFTSENNSAQGVKFLPV